MPGLLRLSDCVRLPKSSIIGAITGQKGEILMSTLADWLQEHGLDQYAGVFVHSKMALDVMPDLTEQDLEKPG
ncbi:MAG: SAM domain-containing protein [Burkholderiales bacterium]